MKKEEWRFIKDFECYQVSNFGRVKSLAREIIYINGRVRFIKEKILKGVLDKDGYLCVSLCRNRTSKTFTIHQLVAIAFFNHVPDGNSLVINHKNFIKLNNRLDNLEIVTNRDNTNKKHIHSTSKYTGVSWHKKNSKWVSEICVNGKRKYLGSFINEYDAHLAYEKELSFIITPSL